MTTAPRATAKTAVLTPEDLITPSPANPQILLPAGVRPFRLNWPYILGIGAYHVVAVMAFLPFYFSWSGLIVAILGTHLCGLFGINLCYHRLLTHRGLKCPKWLEHAMVVIAMSCLQETPARWVAIHRRHHQFADEQPDPHSPLAGFFWSHIGWILVDQPELARLGIYERYARDILRDRSTSRSNATTGWSGSTSHRCRCSSAPDSPWLGYRDNLPPMRRRPGLAS